MATRTTDQKLQRIADEPVGARMKRVLTAIPTWILWTVVVVWNCISGV